MSITSMLKKLVIVAAIIVLALLAYEKIFMKKAEQASGGIVPLAVAPPPVMPAPLLPPAASVPAPHAPVPPVAPQTGSGPLPPGVPAHHLKPSPMPGAAPVPPELLPADEAAKKLDEIRKQAAPVQ